MVLAAYGLKLSERELRRRTGWREQIGTSSTAMVAAARSLGFSSSREVFGLRLHDLRDALRAGVYPIVGIGLEPYGRTGQHAQVVVRVTSRGVSVHDPLLGRLTPNLLTFEAAWQLGDFLTVLIAQPE
jgi:ABC-type bacteriocin/lantibiotic exporter with double-glycine peptidase domain